jgi:FkbM family methyltransferase
MLSTLSRKLRKTSQKVYALEAAAALARAGRAARFPVEFVSQHGEDLLLWDLFDGALTGFFVEAGAFDGKTHSVTYALEAVGWRGLLVEPLPEAAAKCAALRTGSRTVAAALSGPTLAGPATAGAGGASAREAGFRFVHTWGGTWSHLADRPASPFTVDTSREASTLLTVPVTTLNELLADHQGPIDVVVLDVEGAEASVLQGFSLERFRPRVMMIEDNSLGRSGELTAALAGRGYTHAAWSGVNRVYIRNDEAGLFARLEG